MECGVLPHTRGEVRAPGRCQSFRNGKQGTSPGQQKVTANYCPPHQETALGCTWSSAPGEQHPERVGRAGEVVFLPCWAPHLQFLHDPLTPRTPVAGPGSVDGPIHCHWSWRSKQNLRPQPLAIGGWPHTSSSSHPSFPSQVLLPVFSASQCFPLDGSTILETSVPG